MPELADAPVTTTPAPETSSSPSVSSTPAAATPTTPATPSTPAAAERPTNIRELASFMRKLDEAPAATTPETPHAAPPGGPTTQAAAPAPSAGEVPSPTPGPIPFDKHKTILENSRKEFDTYRQQYGWAEQVPPQKLQEFASIAQRMTADPIGFLNEFAAQLANHPTYGPQLRSSAGKTLASAPTGPPPPDVQIMNDKGQVVGMTYSAEAQAAKDAYEWSVREANLKQMIAPVVAAHEKAEQDKAIAELQKEANDEADKWFIRVSGILQGKKELGPKVAELMAQGYDPVDAAIEIRDKFIVPSIAKQAEATVLEAQLKKAAANTVTGNGVAPPPKRPTTQKELAAYLRQLDEASA